MSVRVLSGIIKGIRRSQDRSMKIGAARDKKRRDDELFELQKKKYQLQIEEMKTKGGSDPMLEMLEAQIKDQFKAREAQSKVEDNMIGNADRKQSEVTKNLQRTGSKVASTIMKQRRQQLDWSYNTGSRAFTIRPSKADKAKGSIISASDKVLGALEAGDFVDRKEAETFASENLGIGWETKFPKANEIIDQQFPYEIGKIINTRKGKVKVVGFDKDGEPIIEVMK